MAKMYIWGVHSDWDAESFYFTTKTAAEVYKAKLEERSGLDGYSLFKQEIDPRVVPARLARARNK